MFLFFVFHVNQDRQQDNEECTNHGQGADIKPKQIHDVVLNRVFFVRVTNNTNSFKVEMISSKKSI